MLQAKWTNFLKIDPATADWVAVNADRRWAAFLGYWQDLAEHLGRMPSRRDLDPVEISSSLLPSIFLIDILPADDEVRRTRYRFRLLGGQIVAREKVRSGSFLDALGAGDDLAGIEQHYQDAMAGRIRARDATLVWEARNKEHIGYTTIVLPLAGTDGTVAHLMGCAIYADEKRQG